MLPFNNRLTKNSDFKIVLNRGKSFGSGPVFLMIKKNELDLTRIGFSVGLKFSKKAVERNKIKRLLREIARKNLGYLKSGFDVIIIPRNPREKDFFDWEGNILKALEKADLIKNKK